jgi:hypothetical protein
VTGLELSNEFLFFLLEDYMEDFSSVIEPSWISKHMNFKALKKDLVLNKWNFFLNLIDY